ncbi:hypothetical protein HMPREF9129_0055 [Peptoniphilus indolicus ATCC 29427]|uniref:Uncharacterized protein n=1 Tax=Peptoniphilus indolicus ATCC 29427 TaxID=997350 RepID=G4D0X5_9FIRM|nr:hypothetical protein HMPREF9129_0055 [Peptoniphilus indolicus ATCC 29427]
MGDFFIINFKKILKKCKCKQKIHKNMLKFNEEGVYEKVYNGI